MFKQLINLFIKKNGRSPNALEMLQLKFKAAQQSGKGKVFDMKGNPLDPNKPIIGGTQSEFQSGIIKAIKPKPTVVKQRGPQRGVGAGEQVSAAGATRIKQGFSTQSKLNSWSQNQQWVKDFIGRKNAEFNSLNRADQKSVLDMFEAQIKKHKPKEPLAGGGIAGMLGEPTYEEDNHRVPFKLGGIDKVRRAFLQAMGAGAAGVGAAKTGLFGLLKGGGKKQIVENLTQVPIENAAGMPSWFKPLVNRVIKEGRDISKLPVDEGGALAERQIIHSKKLGENHRVNVIQDVDNQTITVEYQSADNMGGVDDAVRLEYKAAEEIEPMLAQHMNPKDPKGPWLPNKAQKTKPTFEANEAWPHGTTGDYKDITMEGTNIVNKVDDLFSDTSALKQFGTGKDLTKQELKIAKQKRKRVNEINNDLAEQDQLLPDPPEPDFATGGRVPLALGRGTEQAIQENKALEDKIDFEKKILDFYKKKSEDESYGRHMTPMPIPMEGVQHADRPPSDPELQIGPYYPKKNRNWILFDDGTVYYPNEDEYYKQDGTQVEGPSKGAKPEEYSETLRNKAAQGGRVPLALGKIVKGGNWLIKSLRGTREAIKNNKDYSPAQIKLFLKQIDDQIKNLEAGGKIPDEVIQTIRSDPKFKSVGQWQTERSVDPDLREMEEVLLEYGKKHASGGRVGMLFGGGVWKKIIQNLAKEKGISPSAYLAVTNWKHLPEGIKKIISKSQFEKIKKERIEMFENLVDMAKTRKVFSENIEQGKKTPAALAFEHLEKSFKSPVPHGVTDKDILQGEVILKNLKTGGKKGPELNASGGLAGMLGE